MRKSWVVWQEGKAPDVGIELMSESTADFDKTEKKRIYQDKLQAPEYFLYDPFDYELLGYALRRGRYEPIPPDADGGLMSERLGLVLRPWEGGYRNVTARWLRWATPDGTLLPTGEELAERERQRAEQERRRVQEAEQKVEELEAMLARYRERFGAIKE